MVTQRPPRITRSPSSRQCSTPLRGARLERGEAVAAEALRPERHQRGVRRAGDRVLVDAVVRGEDPAGDVLLVARRGDRHQVRQLRQRREIRARRRAPRLHRSSRTIALPLPWRLSEGLAGRRPAPRSVRAVRPARPGTPASRARADRLRGRPSGCPTRVAKRTRCPLHQHMAPRPASRGRTN